MKILILTLWCLIPLGLVAFHYGPGRTGMVLDETALILKSADAHAAADQWPEAISTYELALAKLPKEHVTEARPIRLKLAQARMESAALPKARQELAALSAELEADPKADPKLRDASLAALAGSRFYMTYLMKLEGLPDTEWEPEIEAARQEQKLLFQRATRSGDKQAAARHADDLESAIRLARMEPADLYGKPIPRQCSGCKSGKCAGTKPSRKSTNKKQDARGAGVGAPLDGEGS
jgi:hypothetical protein